MARHEQDREDLLAEATALVERIELTHPGCQEPIVLGARANGCVSIFFGGEPAFHFNTANELRRAFIGGKLYKAERGRLIALTRQRTDKQVELIRHELTDAEQEVALEDLESRIAALDRAIGDGNCTILRQSPDDLPALVKAREWLSFLCGEPAIAMQPHAR